jgi:hypothetical protein
VTGVVLGLFAVMLGGRGFKEFIADTNAANAALGRFAGNLGLAPQNVGELANLVERLGGTVDETKSALEGANQIIQDFLVNGKGIPEVISRMTAQVGGSVDFEHGPLRYLETLAPILQRMNAIDPAKAHAFAQALAIPDSVANTMIKYGAGLAAAMDALGNLQATKDQIKAAQDLGSAWAELVQHVGAYGNSLAEVLDGPMSKLLKGTEHIVDDYRQILEYMVSVNKDAKAEGKRVDEKNPWLTRFAHWLSGSRDTNSSPVNPDVPVQGGMENELSLSNEDLDKITGTAQPVKVGGTEVGAGNPMPVTIVSRGATSFWDWLTGGVGGGGGGGIIGDAVKSLGGAFGGGDYSYTPSTETGNLTRLITDAAKRAGIDPRLMEGIRAGESNRNSRYDVKNDAMESSWGPFQLNRRSGMGVRFERETADERKRLGLGDLRDPRTIPMQADWVAKYIARTHDMSPWMGYRGPRDADPRWGDSGYIPGAGAAAAASLSTIANNYKATTASSVNSMHIGRIDVNAPNATDADGIAAGISPALARSTFAQFANTGPM